VNSTPVALIPSKSEAIELLQMFDDCIDLSEPDSQGWEIFAIIASGWVDSEDHVANSVISFFLRKYQMETFDSYYVAPLPSGLWMSIIILSDAKSAQLLLEFDSQTHSIDDPIPSAYLSQPLVFDIVGVPHAATDILRYLMDKGANIHCVHDGQTPTSKALGSSYEFLPWRDRLWAIYQNLDEFVTSENSTTSILKQSGWQPDTLRIIFSLSLCEARTYTQESTFKFYRHLICERHHSSRIEPWWESFKYRVKTHQCISSMLEEAGMYLDKKYFGELCEDGQTMHKVPIRKQQGHLSRVEFDFYRRGGVWRFDYRPGEIWCWECFIERESLDETLSDSSDIESSDVDGDMESSDEEEEEEDDASDISLD
jgi:hypothetical protein